MTEKNKEYENKCPNCGTTEVDWHNVRWMCEGKETDAEIGYDYPSELSSELSLECDATCEKCNCQFTSLYSLSFAGMKVNSNHNAGKT